jgi:hypothetical protein
MSLNQQAEFFLDLSAGKRSMPVMVTMPSEDDAPPFNFRDEMNPDM